MVGSLEINTILSNQWIIRGAEIDKPIPHPTFLQQDRRRVQRISNHRGPSISYQIRLHDDPHITKSSKDRLFLHELNKLNPLSCRRLEVEVDDVPIEGVVEGFEGPPEIGAITRGAGDEVGEAGEGIGGGGGDGELGFYEYGVVGWRRLGRGG